MQTHMVSTLINSVRAAVYKTTTIFTFLFYFLCHLLSATLETSSLFLLLFISSCLFHHILLSLQFHYLFYIIVLSPSSPPHSIPSLTCIALSSPLPLASHSPLLSHLHRTLLSSLTCIALSSLTIQCEGMSYSTISRIAATTHWDIRVACF